MLSTSGLCIERVVRPVRAAALRRTSRPRSQSELVCSLHNSLFYINRIMSVLLTLLLPLSLTLSAPLIRLVKPVAVTIPGKNVDSVAIWIAPQKENSLVLLTEKGGGQVMVFRADRRATFVSRFGKMKRPNGVAILQGATIGSIRKDLAFITDRDGGMVYIYSVPDFALLGMFGEDISQPMGISVYRRPRDGAVVAFVVPKAGRDDHKVIRFRIVERQGRLFGLRELHFGRELSVGQETVTVDGEREIVFIADENAHDFKVYDVNGKWQSTIGKGVFEAQVEGIVVAKCGTGGYIIASDQKDVTELEVFDRSTFKHLGTIRTSAMRTDGIALTQESLPDYPHGLFIAQSDPEGTGGHHAEFYDFGQLLASIGAQQCISR